MIRDIALHGVIMGLALLVIASPDRWIFFFDLTGNETTIVRFVLMIPLFYSFIRIIGDILE